MIQVHSMLRKSLVECTLSSREIIFLSSIIYIQNGQVTIKVSLLLMIIPSTLLCNSLLGFNIQ